MHELTDSEVMHLMCAPFVFFMICVVVAAIVVTWLFD